MRATLMLRKNVQKWKVGGGAGEESRLVQLWLCDVTSPGIVVLTLETSFIMRNILQLYKHRLAIIVCFTSND